MEVVMKNTAVKEIAVKGDHITLGQLLKLLGKAGSGGEAKQFLEETAVQVNGDPEQRRGRKLRKGDSVVVESEEIRLN